MGLFGLNNFNVKLSSRDLCNAINGIMELVDSDPNLKLNLFEITKDSVLGDRIFFNLNSDKLVVLITDGFRALVYAMKFGDQVQKSFSFSISREDAMKIVSGSFSGQIAFQLTNGNLSIQSQSKNLELVSYQESKDYYHSLELAMKSKVVAEVVIKGSELQHHTSLFGQNETFTLTVDTNNQMLRFDRSKTGYADSVPVEIEGSSLERYINPKLLYPYVVSLRDKDFLHLRFYDPFLIEVKTSQNGSMSYLLMPMIKLNK